MEKKKINAQIVADSVNPQGDRITTFLLTYPRFIHGELMTHRMFSRNSASSRAIPFKKMVEMVEKDPFIPIAWQKDHKGMQGKEYITDSYHSKVCQEDWLAARDAAILSAIRLNSGFHTPKEAEAPAEEGREDRVTKQLCNRLLEPFMWHTVLVTATELENFFALRCPQYNFPDVNQENIFKSRKEVIQHFKDTMYFEKYWKEEAFEIEWLQRNKSQAEIHIQALAEAMWNVMNESIPNQLKAGEWHIPFGDRIDCVKVDIHDEEDFNNIGIKIATARAARLSYMTFDGKIDYEKDIQLHDQLIGPPFHASPFEHCARAMNEEEYDRFFKGEIPSSFVNNPSGLGWCNNFKGFIQYRYLIENEN